VAQKLDEKEPVTFKEMLMANSIQVDALCQLLIEKGLITQQEFFTKLKQVQADYNSKKTARGS
jgi:mannitol/fructose-specific phosphotransferase system IIA component (Ntr-type)